MRARLAILPVLLVAVVAAFPMSPAAASGDRLYLSQAEPGDESNEQNNQGGAGEDPETEVGADEESSEEGAAEVEAGPLWTYQMAWMSFALVLVVLLGAGFWYYRLVVTRQRG